MKLKIGAICSLFLLCLVTAFSAPAATTSGFYDAVLADVANKLPNLTAVGGQSSTGHTVTLTFVASTSAAGCVAPCTLGYNVFRGTATGAESATPLNATPITTTTYTDSGITLGSAPITYFYTVEAVETAGGVTVASGPSNEASATFPGVPVAPTALTSVPK